MLDRPDIAELLQGLSAFLDDDVRPALDDKRLSFRVLIASLTSQTLALQSQAADELRIDALERLAPILGPQEIPLRAGERSALLARLEGELAERIRRGDLDAAPGSPAWRWVRQTLSGELRITNPRFDQSADIE